MFERYDGKPMRIGNKEMPTGDKFNYCPFCVKENIKNKRDPLENLSPLMKQTFKYYVNTAGEVVKLADADSKEYFESFFLCKTCHRNHISIDDFENAYCCKPDGSPLGLKTIPFAVWSEDKKTWVEGVFDRNKCEVVEVH